MSSNSTLNCTSGCAHSGNASGERTMPCGDPRDPTANGERRDMAEKTPKRGKKPGSAKRGKLSLYPLSLEDALRAAAKTGRPLPAPQPNRPKRRQKRTRG